MVGRKMGGVAGAALLFCWFLVLKLLSNNDSSGDRSKLHATYQGPQLPTYPRVPVPGAVQREIPLIFNKFSVAFVGQQCEG